MHDTDKVLQLHSQETVTCYGSQRPTKASGCTAEENWCQVKRSGAEKHSKTEWTENMKSNFYIRPNDNMITIICTSSFDHKNGGVHLSHE